MFQQTTYQPRLTNYEPLLKLVDAVEEETVTDDTIEEPLPLAPNLPTPTDNQTPFIESPAKRKVLVAGRRGGKTTGLAIMAARGLRDGRRVLYATPTGDQLEQFWYAVRAYFKDDIEAGTLYKHEGKHLIERPNSPDGAPRIRAKTAWDADTLRGDWGDLVILDEYQSMKHDPKKGVDAVVLPMMLDTDGTTVYGGTPKRKNKFYHHYVRAIGDDSGRWQAWHFTSHDNPHLSKAALAEISQDLTADDYKQEILAQFLDNEGAVFRNIGANLIPAHYHDAGYWHDGDDHTGHSVTCGVDWAKQQDYTVISVGCRDCMKEIALMRFNKIDYIFQRDKIKFMYERFGISGGLAEANSIGEPNIEALQMGERHKNAHVVMARDEEKGYVMVYRQDALFNPSQDIYGPFLDVASIKPPHVPYDPATCRYGKVIPFHHSMTRRDGGGIWERGEHIIALAINPFQTTATSKPPLIENLVLSLEREEFGFLDIPLATAEMEAYERKVSPATGRSSYNAPSGVHDDTVIARALLRWHISSAPPPPASEQIDDIAPSTYMQQRKSIWQR